VSSKQPQSLRALSSRFCTASYTGGHACASSEGWKTGRLRSTKSWLARSTIATQRSAVPMSVPPMVPSPKSVPDTRSSQGLPKLTAR
jgi:hypothetical protein